LHPQPSLALALQGAARLPGKLGSAGSPRLASAITGLAERLVFIPTRDGFAGLHVRTFHGPVKGSVIDDELLLRGCWALALLAEMFRMGPVPLPAGSPLHALDLRSVRSDDLLGLATPDTVAEIAELRSLARTSLLPHLTGRIGLWALGPTFEGSKLMSADADVIAGGLLVELKTGLGDKRSDGTRRCGLETKTLYQMIGYVLLDLDDTYLIDSVGLYEARYGHFATWSLQDLLDETAGRHVDPADERDQFRALLAGRTARHAQP
jgi:hypothetical protein